MMMPDAWCSAHARPGKAVKSGNSESATFMRNVPEPQRQFSMRRRNSLGQCERIDKVEVEELGINPCGDGRGADRFALVRLNADGAPIFDNDPAHPRRKPDVHAVVTAAFAMAWVMAPMPPIAWPQTPFLPFTSPKLWCRRT